MTRLRVALAQIDPVVGDLTGNAERIIAAIEEAEAAGADIAVFPELAITGYPPEDLLLKPGFVAANTAALEKVAASTRRCVAIVGFVHESLDLYNAAAVCVEGELRGIYHKQLLPNYGVFDEQRYFSAWRWGDPAIRHRRSPGRGVDLRGRVEPLRADRCPVRRRVPSWW